MSQKKERIGWYFYDWANSAFSTTVITVFLGPYLTSIAKNAADGNGFIDVFGLSLFSGSYYAYLVSFSVILQAIFLPIVGAVADFTKAKKLILGLSAYLGAFSTLCLYFVQGDSYGLGGALFVIANLCFGISSVVYNSMLTEISSVEERDTVSSVGWGIGYIGGGLLLLLNLLLVSQAESFGLDIGHAVRICLASAGAWWALFTIIPMLAIKKRPRRQITNAKDVLLSGFIQLVNTIKDARKYKTTLLFLIAYLFFNDGVQAVIALAAQFGSEELGIGMDTLTIVILLVQFVAFPGSLLFNWLSKRIGAYKSLLTTLFIWTAIIIYTFFFLQSVTGFYFIAIAIALVLGGTQALSRSLFSVIIPKDKEAEYFSLYEVSDKGTSWMAPLLFALALQYTVSYRIAIVSLVVFFVIGIILLLKTDIRKAQKEVERNNPN
jgi:UMF1 family MFS transporter